MNGIIDSIMESYSQYPVSPLQYKCQLPSRITVIEITNKLRELIFPGYVSGKTLEIETLQYYIGELILGVKDKLIDQITTALLREACSYGDPENGCEKKLAKRAENICCAFLQAVPKLREYIAADVQAAYDGDPAALDKDQIIASYPGIFAICVYRIAHEFLKLGVPYIPRIMTEYAHNETGIDIHPGAEIGMNFFIDHGTGVVIGETCVIGNNVKIYQGVTLGALSTRGGRSLHNVKRHPTIENNVTIYSGATVLGGNTVIGSDSVIGGGVFITKSTESNMRVSLKAPELEYN
jgi:serine O-acetyltransferase